VSRLSPSGRRDIVYSLSTMLKKLLTLVVLFSVAAFARAGIVDFFNGVTVGKQLPEHKFSFVGEAPETKGKVVLLDFWATWCEPCRKSIPKLGEFQKKFESKGLVVIGLSQEPMENILPYLEKLPMQYFPAVDLEPKIHKALGINGLPYAILVDRSGKIIWRGQPEALTEKVLEAALASPGD